MGWILAVRGTDVVVMQEFVSSVLRIARICKVLSAFFSSDVVKSFNLVH